MPVREISWPADRRAYTPSLADALGDHPLADAFEESAREHAERGVERAFTDDYAGSHWLSSFVLYLLTRAEEGIAPG